MPEKSNENIQIFRETLDIMQAGYYQYQDKKITLKLTPAQQREAILYSADDVAAMREPIGDNKLYVSTGRCRYIVVSQDSYEAAREIWDDILYKPQQGKGNLLVLNFANPVSPGGGVRKGAKAQEEDLCRKSSLLLSLESDSAKPYYETHRKLGHYLASDAMILSPHVEIIRDSKNALLEDTAVVAVLTCAAPAIVFDPDCIDQAGLRKLLYDRIMGMLQLAARMGYTNLVLGAWGCGAFGNDPEVVSDLFYRALKDFRHGNRRERDMFHRIVFAVLARTPEDRNLKAFRWNFDHFYRDEDEAEKQRAQARIRETEVRLDNIRGSLLGGAAGDALGYPVEFLSWDRIKAEYGEGGIREYALDNSKKLALVSDDTQMTLFTACGVLFGDTRLALRGIGAHPSDYIYPAYLDWLETQGEHIPHDPISWILSKEALHARRAPGNTCLSALLSGQRGRIDAPMNNSKGCGGVMRIAPFALAYPYCGKDTLPALDKEGAEIAAITHGHPLGYIPAAFLTHVIHQAVFGKGDGVTLRGIVAEAIGVIGQIFSNKPELSAFISLIDRAVEYAAGSRADADNIHALGGGWVADEAVAIAIYCALKYETDFSRALIAAVNHSGDSDSTGAITGNILGAWLGYAAIADKWKQNLELSDLILELADDLCHGCQMDEHSGYADQAWLNKYDGYNP